jgi:hypothetical protein
MRQAARSSVAPAHPLRLLEEKPKKRRGDPRGAPVRLELQPLPARSGAGFFRIKLAAPPQTPVSYALLAALLGTQAARSVARCGGCCGSVIAPSSLTSRPPCFLRSVWRPREGALKPMPVQGVLAVTLGEAGGSQATVVSVLTGAGALHVRAESEEAALEWAAYTLGAAAEELGQARRDTQKRQAVQMVRRSAQIQWRELMNRVYV